MHTREQVIAGTIPENVVSQLKFSEPAQRVRVQAALLRDETVYALDTGTSGGDDTLLGDEDTVIGEVLAYHELDSWPKDWSLCQVSLANGFGKWYIPDGV